jgi:glycine/D-amino acid oxidase-like deaminating enzyme
LWPLAGGGIIGCTTAYYLTRHPSFDPAIHSVTLLEATRLGGGASGKAGGLLAQWAYPTSIVPLSFDLHSDLAAEHNGVETWGYRRIRCGKLTARDRNLSPLAAPTSWMPSWIPLGKRRFQQSSNPRNLPETDLPDDLDWFNSKCVESYEDISTTSATAQVHPFQFTTAMAKLAEESGAKIVIGSVDRINYTNDVHVSPQTSGEAAPVEKRVQSVTYTEKETFESWTIPATVVVLAAGPWTPVLFPAAPISALRAHSVTIRPPKPVSAYCLFTDITIPMSPTGYDSGNDGSPIEPLDTTKTVNPEIYSRPNNEVYVCSAGDKDIPLPANTDEVEVSRERCQDIVDAVAGVSDDLREGVVTSRRACYLPTVDVGGSGGPLIGKTGVPGLLLATGHSCWGIHNAPVTGKLISEIIFDGEAVSADISALDPQLVV